MIRWLWRGLIVLGVFAVVATGWLWIRREQVEPLPLALRGVSAARLKDVRLIARGAYLATAGACNVCHTAQGGPAYAGGRSVMTPFGTIASSNLTPDPETGLGNWQFADFWRALHGGIRRDGALLYPAFPYTAYTKVSPDDALAIFAYLRSLPAVHQTAIRPNLRFPYSERVLLAGWRALYFREGGYQPDANRTAQWNRGAYLVNGLGHCGECHDARNGLGAVAGQRSLSGGEMPAQNWYAPDLSMASNGGLHGWSTSDVVDLLKTGQSSRAVAFGPMAEVVARSTQHLSENDLQAIAAYLQTLPARRDATPPRTILASKRALVQGATIYADRCENCHGKDGEGVRNIYPALNGNASINDAKGMNATRIVLLGGFSPGTAANPRPYSMPPFAQQLSDADVAAVVTYVRASWTNHAPAVQERDVGTYRATPVD